jgi:hypothetical protein
MCLCVCLDAVVPLCLCASVASFSTSFFRAEKVQGLAQQGNTAGQHANTSRVLRADMRSHTDTHTRCGATGNSAHGLGREGPQRTRPLARTHKKVDGAHPEAMKQP